MTIIKTLLNRLKKTDNSFCICSHKDRCKCECHNRPMLHIVECCSLKKCYLCGKNYRKS